MKGLLFFVVILSSCSGFYGVKSYKTLSDGGTRPKRNNFSFAKHPYVLKDTSLIDTNGVYLDILTNIYAGAYHFDTTYIIYRFFNNGRLFVCK